MEISRAVVQALNSTEEDLSSLGKLIEAIKLLFKESPAICISHASRLQILYLVDLLVLDLIWIFTLNGFSHASYFIVDAFLFDRNRM